MFIILKLEQMIDYVLSVRLKRRAQKEKTQEREREREAITSCIQFFISVAQFPLKI